MAKRFIVEHMEPVPLGEWVRCEYLHMLEEVGEDAMVFTKLSASGAEPLQKKFPNVRFHAEAIADLAATVFPPSRMCLLDMAATEALKPEDADKFDAFLFGGILGDDPPQHRTRELYPVGCELRHLGNAQMTTDTAVIVAHRIIVGGQPLEKMTFVETPEVRLGEKEFVGLPFRYLIKPGTTAEPMLPKGLVEHLRDSADDPLF